MEFLILALIIGSLVSLLALMPFLRQRAKASFRYRVTLLSVLGGIAFCIAYVIATGLTAIILSAFAFEQSQAAEFGDVFIEFWLQILISPIFTNCYSANSAVCQVVSNWPNFRQAQVYLFPVGYSLLPMLIAISLAKIFTEPSTSQEQA